MGRNGAENQDGVKLERDPKRVTHFLDKSRDKTKTRSMDLSEAKIIRL
jgi:hypothetical protein